MGLTLSWNGAQVAFFRNGLKQPGQLAQSRKNALAVFSLPDFEQAGPSSEVVDVILIDGAISPQGIFEDGDEVGVGFDGLTLSLEEWEGGFAHVSRPLFVSTNLDEAAQKV